MSRRVVLFSEHVFESGRRAGFHWLTDAYRAAGWHATFVTTGVSPISALKKDYRVALVPPAARNTFRDIASGLSGYFWYPPFHPVNLRSRFANWASAPLFRAYAALPLGELAGTLADADTIILESSPALALVPRLRRLAPKAFLVYRVSDDVRVVGGHPVLAEFERRAIPYFDLISIPSDHMLRLFPPDAPAAVQYHGLQMALLDQATDNPYPPGIHAISVGTTLFDRQAVESFAQACPDVQFHLFGHIAPFSQDNVTLYGERSFAELVPYLQHASVGLAPYLYRPGCEYLTHTSNKMMQYTYCRLPVLLPSYIPNTASHIVSYLPHDSVDARRAMCQALEIERATIDVSSITTWLALQEAIEHLRPAGR